MDIRSKVVSALRWSAASRFFGQLFSWVVTIYVIRLLSPADYGLMAMAMVVVSFLILLNTYGLDAVLVQKNDLDEQVRRQVFGLVIILNLGFFLLVFLGAAPIAALYGQPDLVPVLQVLSLQFLLLIFETLPQSRLEGDIKFAGRSVVDLITVVLGSLVTLVLALTGAGVWALVWGALVITAARVIGLNLLCGKLVRPSFSLRGLRGHLSFGGFVTLDRGLWYLFAESDKFIGGKLLGSHPLGYYAVASQLASLPIQKISGLLNAVAFPAFSRAHSHDGDQAVQRYLLKATRLMAVVAFPVFFGISCTAQPLIAALLGEKWLPAAPLLQVLGIVMPLRLLSNVFPPLLWGVGHPRSSAANLLIAAILMPLAFYLGTRWGVLGLAYAWLAMYPLVFVLTLWRTLSVVRLSLPTYLGQLLKPLAGAIAMYVLVTGFSSLGYGSQGEWLRLAQMILLGVTVYGLVMWLIDRGSLQETLELIRT